jgi:hypothetical protein
MKRRLKKYTSLTHYIEFLRRQPEHMQHIYAVIFAGSITLMLAFVILYVDYGFWHETYVRGEVETISLENSQPNKPEANVQSPKDMLGDFFKEAAEKLERISISSTTLPTGKDTYKRE